jgi:hypothetical protein
VLLAIQEFAGPLMGGGTTDAGKAFMAATGHMLTGGPKVFRDEWLARQGYDAEQREEIHRECRLELNREGFAADFRDVLESHEPDTSASGE